MIYNSKDPKTYSTFQLISSDMLTFKVGGMLENVEKINISRTQHDLSVK